MKNLLLILVVFSWVSANTQTAYFGKKRIASAHFTYLPVVENEQVSGSYAATNVNFLISLHKHLYGGVYYGSMSQRIDHFSIRSRDVFHKGGILVRYKEPIFQDRGSFNLDLSLGYSNYSLDPDGDHFISHHNYQIGINGLVDFRIKAPFYISGGFVGHRTIKKGDYGYELLPMIGINIQF